MERPDLWPTRYADTSKGIVSRPSSQPEELKLTGSPSNLGGNKTLIVEEVDSHGLLSGLLHRGRLCPVHPICIGFTVRRAKMGLLICGLFVFKSISRKFAGDDESRAFFLC